MLETIKNNINSDLVSVVVIWVITILIAGFIAQFGKRLADYLTDKIKTARGKKAGIAAGLHLPQKSPAVLLKSRNEEQMRANSDKKARLKLEKKRAKTLAKKDKKRS